MTDSRATPEVSVSDLIWLIFRYKWVILAATLIGAAIGYGVFIKSPKVYTARSVFFLPQEQNSAPSFASRYSSLLGIQSAGLDSKIVTFGRSGRIKAMVLPLVQDELNLSKAEFAQLSWAKELSIINSGNGFFSVSYTSLNPTWSAKIVEIYLQQLGVMLQELDVTSRRDVIKTLDPVTTPTHPDNASYVNFVIFGGIGGAATMLFLIFCYEYFRSIVRKDP